MLTKEDHALAPTKKTAILPLCVVPINHSLHDQAFPRSRIPYHPKESWFDNLAIPHHFVIDEKVDVFISAGEPVVRVNAHRPDPATITEIRPVNIVCPC